MKCKVRIKGSQCIGFLLQSTRNLDQKQYIYTCSPYLVAILYPTSSLHHGKIRGTRLYISKQGSMISPPWKKEKRDCKKAQTRRIRRIRRIIIRERGHPYSTINEILPSPWVPLPRPFFVSVRICRNAINKEESCTIARGPSGNFEHTKEPAISHIPLRIAKFCRGPSHSFLC